MKLKYETDRLILKILEPSSEHARQVLTFYEQNREILENYEPRTANFYTENYQKTLLTGEYNLAMQKKTIRFWIFPKDNPEQLIGTICFYNITHSVYERCSTGYKLDQKYWHQGYAQEAMKAGISVMFEDLNLHRIEAYVMEKNLPSIRLLERLGFQHEGTCRQLIRIRDEWENHRLYALIK